MPSEQRLMGPWPCVLLGWCLVAASNTALLRAADTPSPALSPQEEGAQLATELCQVRPIQGAGVLRLRDGNGRWFREVRVQMQVVETPDAWQGSYQTTGSAEQPGETLAITHRPGQPNRYHYHREGGEQDREFVGSEACIPFARSEFSLSDLGLEFYRWPQQKILKQERRKGRLCTVLESVQPNPTPGSYRRVLSWVDQEHRGILRVEAFDGEGRLTKEFSIGSFTKVKSPNGEVHWQLKSMEIRNEQTDARTRIEFDLKLPEDDGP